jgi:hypothetical protein
MAARPMGRRRAAAALRLARADGDRVARPARLAQSSRAEAANRTRPADSGPRPGKTLAAFPPAATAPADSCQRAALPPGDSKATADSCQQEVLPQAGSRATADSCRQEVLPQAGSYQQAALPQADNYQQAAAPAVARARAERAVQTRLGAKRAVGRAVARWSCRRHLAMMTAERRTCRLPRSWPH